MKTPEEKLRFIMEAADECEATGYFDHGRPLPDDMRKLMELAKKDGYSHIEFWTHKKTSKLGKIGCRLNPLTGGIFYGHGADEAEALLNALFVAKGGLEDE